jgi:uncharacterized DUF497 family protein
MPFLNFFWTDEAIEHIAEHGVSQEDFEQVVCRPDTKGFSRSSRLPAAWGYTADDRYIMAVYEDLDNLTVRPVTAYEVPEPK